jgi:hypothetical protein
MDIENWDLQDRRIFKNSFPRHPVAHVGRRWTDGRQGDPLHDVPAGIGARAEIGGRSAPTLEVGGDLEVQVKIGRDEPWVVGRLDREDPAAVVVQEILGGGAAADPGGRESEGALDEIGDAIAVGVERVGIGIGSGVGPPPATGAGGDGRGATTRGPGYENNGGFEIPRQNKKLGGPDSTR